MGEIDPDHYDDERAATVGDLRLLYTKVQQLFALALGLFFATGAVVFIKFGDGGEDALALAVCAGLMYFVAFAHEKGYSRRVLSRIPVGLPAKPAIGDRSIGERSDERAEVTD